MRSTARRITYYLITIIFWTLFLAGLYVMWTDSNEFHFINYVMTAFGLLAAFYFQSMLHDKIMPQKSPTSQEKPQNETIITVDRICETCGGKVDKYDTFTEEEHCQNCGW